MGWGPGPLAQPLPSKMILRLLPENCPVAGPRASPEQQFLQRTAGLGAAPAALCHASWSQPTPAEGQSVEDEGPEGAPCCWTPCPGSCGAITSWSWGVWQLGSLNSGCHRAVLEGRAGERQRGCQSVGRNVKDRNQRLHGPPPDTFQTMYIGTDFREEG